MEGVCFEGFAGMFCGDFVEGPSAGQVNGQRDEQHKDGGEAGLDVDGMKEEPVEGLVNDVEGGEDEEAGFDEGGEVFEFAVAVRVAGVSGLVGYTDREKSDDGGDKIKAGMEGFGQDAETGSAPNEEGLQAKKQHSGPDAEQGSALLFLNDLIKAACENHEV